MGLPRATLPAFALAVAALCPCHRVLADGKFFRLLEVADEPGVRAQRAVLAFKDGVETLLVQSDVEGRGASLGWVLPLPAEPTAVEACQPHCLSWLSRVVQPALQHVVLWPLRLAIVLLVITGAVCADRLGHREGERRGLSLLSILVGTLALFLFVFLPALLLSADMPKGVEVVRTIRAGVYDVSIVRGESADGVLRWLNANGFACPPAAVPVLGDYVSRGWCFLTAKVAPDSDGLSAHHPLRIRFPAKEAVYPLRLTGVDAEPMTLDLFTIGAGRASARGMRTWVCDSFSSESSYESRFSEYLAEAPAVFRGDTTDQPIGIPDVSSLMWPGCILTRLHGRLTASSMTSDLAVRWSQPAPTRAKLYSGYAAAVSGATVAVLVLSLTIAWGTRTAVRAGWRLKEAMRRRFLAGLLVALLMGVIRYSSVEVVTLLDRGNPWVPGMAMHEHAQVLRDLRAQPPDDPFPKAYARLLQASRPRKVTFGEQNTLEEPGDYHVEASESGWRLTILDLHYVPVTVAISSNGVPMERQEAADGQ